MATFETQVEALTGISLGSTSNPTQDELTQYLNDGVIDVTRRWLAGHAEEADQFTRISGEVTSNGSEKVARADIISVVRESGTNNDWRPCTKISPVIQSQVVDAESLSFASKYHPVYMVAEDGAISVFPTPGVTTDAFKVYYVNNDPRGDDDNSVTYETSGLAFFPKSKVYLVVLYASIKTLQTKMGSQILSVVTVPPDVPAAPAINSVSVSATTASAGTVTVNTAGSLGTAPVYTAPTIAGETEELTAAIDADSAGVGTDADFLDFSKWYSVVGEYIEDQEDTELASTQLQKITTYLSTYTAAMQNKLHIFNDANVEYQASIQEVMKELDVAHSAAVKDADIAHSVAMKNADLAAAKAIKDADLARQKEYQEYTLKLQKYSSETSEYQATVNSEVQEKTTKMQQYQLLHAQLKIEYNSAFVAPGAEE